LQPDRVEHPGVPKEVSDRPILGRDQLVNQPLVVPDNLELCRRLNFSFDATVKRTEKRPDEFTRLVRIKEHFRFGLRPTPHQANKGDRDDGKANSRRPIDQAPISSFNHRQPPPVTTPSVTPQVRQALTDAGPFGASSGLNAGSERVSQPKWFVCSDPFRSDSFRFPMERSDRGK
jgi:hypothetical protein